MVFLIDYSNDPLLQKQIPYEEKFGAVHFPEGFLETLQGLSLEEQMGRYRIHEHNSFSGDWRQRVPGPGYSRLEDSAKVLGLIVKEGLLVGVVMSRYDWNQGACLAEGRVITEHHFESDRPGDDYFIYHYLLCVPGDFDQKA